MGIFHCPFGCPHYEAEGCIDCGLCAATTSAEMVEASKKVRAYLKEHAQQGGPIKKIAVCGKGGVGKSTLVTLMARAAAKAMIACSIFSPSLTYNGCCLGKSDGKGTLRLKGLKAACPPTKNFLKNSTYCRRML